MIKRTRYEADGTTDIYEETTLTANERHIKRWRFWMTVVLSINSALTFMNYMDVHTLLRTTPLPDTVPNGTNPYVPNSTP